MSFFFFTISVGFIISKTQALQIALTAYGGDAIYFNYIISFGSKTPKAYSAANKAGIASSKSY